MRASRSRSRICTGCRARSTPRSRAPFPATSAPSPKVDELHFDAVLHDSHDEDHYHLKSIVFPPAMARRRDRARAARRRAEALGRAAQARRRRSLRARRASCEPERDRAVRHGRPAPARDARAHGGALRRALQDARAEHSVPRDDHAPGAGPSSSQEADRRRRPVRRGVSAGRAADARRGIRVRRRSRRRRDSRPVHSRGREGRAPVLDRRRGRGLPAAGSARRRLRRQVPLGGFEGSCLRFRRPARVPQRLSRSRPDRARAGRAHRSDDADRRDRRHHRRSRDAPRTHERHAIACRPAHPHQRARAAGGAHGLPGARQVTDGRRRHLHDGAEPLRSGPAAQAAGPDEGVQAREEE